ncbi:STM3941 family protein [Mucilaginibacter angelicae]|uniref:STM3941 family protein n=1 Tax=Mucilaginibacter angelicae TaxID=869718 RepID=A0ABV6LFT9_9SPHI
MLYLRIKFFVKYYFKFASELWGLIFNHALWLCICWIHVIRSASSNFSYFYFFAGIVWVLLTVFRFIKLHNLISLALKKQPLLEANENYLYDHVSGIKFYWDDIEEISNDEYVLLLKTYDPSKYLSQFRRPIDRFYNYSKKKKVFKISLDYIKADLKNLGETLNNFSILALAIQEGKK